MHVGKPLFQPALVSQMYEWRGSRLPRPDAGDVMVHCQNLKNASYALVNIYGFLWVLAKGPYNIKPVKTFPCKHG